MAVVGEPELFIETPNRGTSVFGSADYCGPTGPGMLCEYRYEVISDIDDARFRRWSVDNGRTWSDPVELPVSHRRDDGAIVRRTSSACFVDPGSGHLVLSGTEWLQESDDAFDALTRVSRFYALSADGGRSLFHEAPIIQQGAGYDRWHPIDGVHTGRNAFTGLGTPLARDGGLLFPVSRTALDADGRYFNPYGSSYIETGCLAARFSGDRLVAESVAWIIPDPERTTRGIFEPTLAALDGGRLLMVMRGSNGGRAELPATSGARSPRMRGGPGLGRTRGRTRTASASSRPARSPTWSRTPTAGCSGSATSRHGMPTATAPVTRSSWER